MSMAGRRLKGIVQDSSFPSFLMLVILIIVNAILQPGFFSFQIFRMNSMTFTPLILVSLAQATLLLVGAVDLSLGAGISLVTAVMASLMRDDPLSIVLVCLLGVAVALGLSLFNGAVIGIIGPPPLILTFATSTIWFGLALVLMPTPGGHIPEAFYGLYGKSLAHLVPCRSWCCWPRLPCASCWAGCARSATSTRSAAMNVRRGRAASTSRG